MYCAAATATEKNSCYSATQSDAAGRCVFSHFAYCWLFFFLPGKLNADERAWVIAVSPTWSIYIAAPLREFAPENLPFDLEMATLCEECFQHLVIRWLDSLCVIVASPLWSKVESGCISISEHAERVQMRERHRSLTQQETKQTKCWVLGRVGGGSTYLKWMKTKSHPWLF